MNKHTPTVTLTPVECPKCKRLMAFTPICLDCGTIPIAEVDRVELVVRVAELVVALHTLCCAADSVCDKRAGAVADLSEATAQVRRKLRQQIKT